MAVKAAGWPLVLVWAALIVASWFVVIILGGLGGLIVVGFLNVVFP